MCVRVCVTLGELLSFHTDRELFHGRNKDAVRSGLPAWPAPDRYIFCVYFTGHCVCSLLNLFKAKLLCHCCSASDSGCRGNGTKSVVVIKLIGVSKQAWQDRAHILTMCYVQNLRSVHLNMFTPDVQAIVAFRSKRCWVRLSFNCCWLSTELQT